MRLRWLTDSSSGKTATHQPVRLYLIGLLADRLHDVRTVDAMAVRLRALKDAARYADPALARSYALGLEGLSARLRGHVQLAISRLQSVPFDQFPDYRAGALGSQTYERFVLADLLFASGRASEANAWLRAIGDGLETSWYPAAHLRLAEIAE